MNNILALDLSSKSSGYAVSIDNQLVDYGEIQSSSTDVVKRIMIMRDGVIELIRKYNINRIVVEEVRTDYKNAHTYKILTWLQGSVVIAAREADSKIDIKYIQPSSWRSKIGIKTGRGIKREELKRADIQYVKDKYNINVGDDAADAIGILDSELLGM